MSRYATQPVVRSNRTTQRAEWDDYAPMLPSLSVDGEKQVDTGLVDAKGNRIVRLQDPIGFRK